ncbi:MAG: saccharopine dehydrogenase C-terminal domain-containing protein [Bdellovibrionota bacterium]
MPNKKKVVIFGAGKIGRLVSIFLAQTNDYAITLVDLNTHFLERVKKLQSTQNIEYEVSDFSNEEEIKKVLTGKHYALSCAPFFCNNKIAEVASALNVHYLDLTEDVKTTNYIKKIAKNSSCAFIPQCGLAPGFITIVANHLVKKFDSIEDVKMRVGALPMYPHNRLKYNLTWSTDGLINEYCNDCEVIMDGTLHTVQPLEGEERFNIEGEEYEAFNTSGGLGTFAESLSGRVKNMDYKSIRYPGHREILLTLLHDLKFKEDRDGLKKLFERAIPHTFQDVVIIFVTVTGQKKGYFCQENYSKKIVHTVIDGENWGAIQITTAAGICAVLDLHAHGEIQQKGFIKQEEISFEKFSNNRFGKYYSSC